MLTSTRAIFAAAAALMLSFAAASAKQPADLAGPWDLSLDSAGTNCRVTLNTQKSDKGSFFLGMPAACRHAMPGVAAIGRWIMPDDQHLTLTDPAGTPILQLAASGDGFQVATQDGTYALKPGGASGRSAVGFAPVDAAAAPAHGFAAVEPVAKRRSADEAPPAPVTTAEISGRYAVMREKRDTGCMLTLDSSRVKGGGRAQLAPGCRDQGIVVFDPSAWQIVKGELILTARAGHKARLGQDGEGAWAKDPKEGGKPLGLKKL